MCQIVILPSKSHVILSDAQSHNTQTDMKDTDKDPVNPLLEPEAINCF